MGYIRKGGPRVSLAEQWKYEKAYELTTYRMGPNRHIYACEDIRTIPPGSSYLDVGCGRGETLDFATENGIAAQGIETVPALCNRPDVQHGDVCNLPFPDGAFDFVSCYDVLEHLPPGEEQAALSELNRVARRGVFLSTNDRPSKLPDGTDLHVNKRKHGIWQADIEKHFAGAVITAGLKGPHRDWHWRIDKVT